MTAKHNLKNNGAAYNEHAELINPDPKVTSGEGRALCTCGAISDPLPTGGARRVWHKEHKAQAATAPQQTELVLGQDVAAGTPEDEVAEALAELVADQKPAKRAARKEHKDTRKTARAGLLAERKAKQAAEEAPAAGTTVEVPFTNTVAAHFWFHLGRPSAKMLAEKYPELHVGHDDKARTITVTGEQGLAQLAAAELAATWAAAPEAFTAWKRDTPEYVALKHTVVEDRRTSRQLTLQFFATFAREQLLG